MKARTKQYYLFGIFLILILFQGCGGGSGEPNSEDLSYNSNNSILDNNGRTIAINTMRIVQLTRDHQQWTEDASKPVQNGTINCEHGGNKALSVSNNDQTFGNHGDQLTIQYSQCKESTVAGNQTRTGNITISFNAENTEISSAALDITLADNSQFKLKSFQSSTIKNSNSSTTTFDFDADVPHINLYNLKVETTSPLNGENINCPHSGTIKMDTTDNTTAKIKDFDASNMVFIVDDGDSSTIACTEIVATPHFTPPPLPGR